ncbi:MAG: 50S ribosomal protein L23 [Patescibacteria group bacterium]
MGIFDTFKSKKDPAKGEKTEKGKVSPKVPDEKKMPEKVKIAPIPEKKQAATPDKTEGKAKKSKITKEDTGNAYRVLIKPLISEKGSLIGMYNQYIFQVAPGTNRVEVRKAIRKLYGVDPIKVNIMNVRGKKIRYGRSEGQTKAWKKAVITLAAGQKIEIQEGL